LEYEFLPSTGITKWLSIKCYMHYIFTFNDKESYYGKVRLGGMKRIEHNHKIKEVERIKYSESKTLKNGNVK
jgi:hypothetical protein